MDEFNRLSATQEQTLKRSAKIVLDNAEFNVVYEYLLSQASDTLQQGSFAEAESNLRNLRAVMALKQAMVSISDG